MEIPKYKHHCKDCIFLGRSYSTGFYTNSKKTEVDLYFCPPPTSSLLARKSDETSDYWSIDIELVDKNSEIYKKHEFVKVGMYLIKKFEKQLS